LGVRVRVRVRVHLVQHAQGALLCRHGALLLPDLGVLCEDEG
jgi:hypothetical protein